MNPNLLYFAKNASNQKNERKETRTLAFEVANAIDCGRLGEHQQTEKDECAIKL